MPKTLKLDLETFRGAGIDVDVIEGDDGRPKIRVSVDPTKLEGDELVIVELDARTTLDNIAAEWRRLWNRITGKKRKKKAKRS